MSDQTLHGGCLCRQVRYTATGPAMSLVCHCTDCQKQSGSAFSMFSLYPSDRVTYSGTLAAYDHHADSGRAVSRLFCGNCGSPVVTRCELRPGFDIIKCGTLDDTSTFTPVAEIFYGSRQHWFDLPIDQKFAQSVPTEMLDDSQ